MRSLYFLHLNGLAFAIVKVLYRWWHRAKFL